LADPRCLKAMGGRQIDTGGQRKKKKKKRGANLKVGKKTKCWRDRKKGTHRRLWLGRIFQSKKKLVTPKAPVPCPAKRPGRKAG